LKILKILAKKAYWKKNGIKYRADNSKIEIDRNVQIKADFGKKEINKADKKNNEMANAPITEKYLKSCGKELLKSAKYISF
jgi:hypothetical protein